MSNVLSKGASMWKTISGRGQLLLAGLLVLAVAVVALTLFVTTSQRAAPAAVSNAAAAAAIQPQAAQPAQAQSNAAQAQEVPYPDGFEQQHIATFTASPLERIYLREQLEQDMCEGACGR